MKKSIVNSFLIFVASNLIITQVSANNIIKDEYNLINQQSYTNKKFYRTKSLENMMQWFNYIADHRNSFIKSELEKYFAPNFVMRMNGKIKVRGYDELYNHFEKFRKSGLLIQVSLPFEQVIIPKNPKKLVTKYTLNAFENGQHAKIIWDLAIWTFSDDNRVEYMDEVAFIEELKSGNNVLETQILQN